MKIAVVCATGIGDALILHILSHHLQKQGHDVTTFSPHLLGFGKWLQGYKFDDGDDFSAYDTIFLQHDNTERSKAIHSFKKAVYTFYGSYQLSKHGPIRPRYDYVCDLNQTMADNVVNALKLLFKIPKPTKENGLKPPEGLIHRRHINRVAIHTTSGAVDRNWPKEKFQKCAKWLELQGFEPAILPQFPSLEGLTSFIYESGFFLGNDSGPGHIASYLEIPHLIIGREEKHMRHWRPGWTPGEVVFPPTWVPRRIRTNHWKKLITTKSIINRLKNNVLAN